MKGPEEMEMGKSMGADGGIVSSSPSKKMMRAWTEGHEGRKDSQDIPEVECRGIGGGQLRVRIKNEEMKGPS